MTFEYEYKIISDNGVVIELCSDSIDWPDYIYIDDNEFEAKDDLLYGIAVLIDSKWTRISDLYSKTVEIYEEMDQEADEQEKAQEDLRKDYYAGVL